MPTNLYGPYDNFNLEDSHVVPALIRKAHEAKNIDAKVMEVWGSGKVRREFLHVDDCARAIIFLMKNYSDHAHINVGTGLDITINDLVEIISKAVGFNGKIKFDLSKPDGTPRKLLDISKISQMGWKHKINIEDGIRSTYAHEFTNNNNYPKS